MVAERFALTYGSVMENSRVIVPTNRRVNFGQAIVLFLLTTSNLAGDRARAHIGILHSGLFFSLSFLLF